MKEHLNALREDFNIHAGRSLALPLAGAITWTVIGVLATLVSSHTAILIMLFGSGIIFPLGMLLSVRLREKPIANTSPLANLMGLSVLMVNLLWAVHLSLFFGAHHYLALSLSISLGLHWIVFSWIINHHVGIVHAILRTLLVTVGWWLFPDNQVSAVAIAVVIAYIYALYTLGTRDMGERYEYARS